MNDVATRANPVLIFKKNLDEMEGQFRAALPKQIPSEKFVRVALTAVQINPQLLSCAPRLLFNELMKCANDGLLPDGREAVITTRKDKHGNLIPVYMPMITGIRRKARNSGEIASWDVHVVYDNDVFEYALGDDAKIVHKPALENRGHLCAAYSICRLTSGEISREVMGKEDIDRIEARGVSSAWKSDKAEMWRKTVGKRHAKSLPMSSEVAGLIDYDNGADMEEAPSAPRGRPPKALEGPMTTDEGFGGGVPSGDGEQRDPPHDPDTGEVITDDMAQQAQARTAEALADPTGDKAGELLASKLDDRTAMSMYDKERQKLMGRQ